MWFCGALPVPDIYKANLHSGRPQKAGRMKGAQRNGLTHSGSAFWVDAQIVGGKEIVL